MSGHGLTYKSTMCNPKIYASNFVAISIFMIFSINIYILHRICFSSQEKQLPAITPPK